MDNLFDLAYKNKKNDIAPLAERLRPRNLEEFYGQDHILGEGKLLNRLIESDRLTSMIFYGPPGTGKTTLANIIANQTENNFYKMSAVTAGVKDIKEITNLASSDLKIYNKKTILFIDEIHRFNKAQQDVLLPYAEDGSIILIGATTENPIFEVNKALLSRSRIIEFKSISSEDLFLLAKRAISDKKRGFGDKNILITDSVIDFLINYVEGDARNLLNSLELAIITTKAREDGQIEITKDDILNCVQRNNLRYDKDGNMHYDIISAYIKSIRASEVDPALYYLAQMLESGEDPKFIARRLIISASEDIGLADPNALNIAVSTFHAVNFIGMPEARIPLAEATIYLASTLKSNSAYLAINKAMDFVRNNKTLEVPENLKNIHVGDVDEKDMYKYSHDYEDGIVKQNYLEGGRNMSFFSPNSNGFEKNIRDRLSFIKSKKEATNK